ncbi:transposase [Actinomyces viscosus]|uniref:IS3 family transposase n=1 Tax=Actinomyces viscosus TaxID=1656 RepID=UPI000F831448|nr:transposase [Actinomyces viscosus]
MPTREGTYGYRRIQAHLERRGVRVDGATVRSIMRDLGLEAAQPRAKVRTYRAGRGPRVSAPTWWGATPAAHEPGREWCGDIPPQAGGTPSYIRRVGRVRLSCYGSGLLHQEGRGVCDGRAMCAPRWCVRPSTWRSGDARPGRV